MIKPTMIVYEREHLVFWCRPRPSHKFKLHWAKWYAKRSTPKTIHHKINL